MSTIIAAYQKMCDFLISQLYSTSFLKMDDVRYSRCRENIKGQKELASELGRNIRVKVSSRQSFNPFSLFSSLLYA